MTPTGFNLLGLVKHVASVEAGYLGETFDRPFPEPLPWFEDDAEPNADMWASADESREQIVSFYRGLGARGRHDRHVGARRRRSRPALATRAQRGHAAPDPGALIAETDRHRPRRHRP